MLHAIDIKISINKTFKVLLKTNTEKKNYSIAFGDSV